jgi:hypothetical protein
MRMNTDHPKQLYSKNCSSCLRALTGNPISNGGGWHSKKKCQSLLLGGSPLCGFPPFVIHWLRKVRILGFWWAPKSTSGFVDDLGMDFINLVLYSLNWQCVIFSSS